MFSALWLPQNESTGINWVCAVKAQRNCDMIGSWWNTYDNLLNHTSQGNKSSWSLKVLDAIWGYIIALQINLSEFSSFINASCLTKDILQREGKCCGALASKFSSQFRSSSLAMLPKAAFLVSFPVIWLWLRSSFSSSDSSLKTSVGITDILPAAEYNSLRHKGRIAGIFLSWLKVTIITCRDFRERNAPWRRIGGITEKAQCYQVYRVQVCSAVAASAGMLLRSLWAFASLQMVLLYLHHWSYCSSGDPLRWNSCTACVVVWKVPTELPGWQLD